MFLVISFFFWILCLFQCRNCYEWNKRGLDQKSVDWFESQFVADEKENILHFFCDNSTTKLTIDEINDYYCDCEDGMDEPGTPSCSNRGQDFFCLNEGKFSQYLKKWRVDDGKCDCCDGFDENEAYSNVSCPNTCNKLYKEQQEKEGKVKKEREVALGILEKKIQQGKTYQKYVMQRVQFLNVMIEHIDKKITQLEEYINDTVAESDSESNILFSSNTFWSYAKLIQLSVKNFFIKYLKKLKQHQLARNKKEFYNFMEEREYLNNVTSFLADLPVQFWLKNDDCYSTEDTRNSYEFCLKYPGKLTIDGKFITIPPLSAYDIPSYDTVILFYDSTTSIINIKNLKVDLKCSLKNDISYANSQDNRILLTVNSVLGCTLDDEKNDISYQNESDNNDEL